VTAFDSQRSKLVKDEEKDSARLAGRNAEVDKARTAAMGGWEKLVAIKKQRDQEMTTKKRADKLADFNKEIAKAKTKVKASFIEFEKLQKKSI